MDEENDNFFLENDDTEEGADRNMDVDNISEDEMEMTMSEKLRSVQSALLEIKSRKFSETTIKKRKVRFDLPVIKQSDSGKDDDEPIDNPEPDDEMESGDNESDESRSERELKEDIYGRIRDKEGNVVSANSSVKYVPPAKRIEIAKGGDSKYQEKLLRVKKLLKGQINRYGK